LLGLPEASRGEAPRGIREGTESPPGDALCRMLGYFTPSSTRRMRTRMYGGEGGEDGYRPPYPDCADCPQCEECGAVALVREGDLEDVTRTVLSAKPRIEVCKWALSPANA